MTASWGCAWDARRCARRRPPEARWRSDPRMRMVDVGGSVLRVLDIGDAGGQAPIVLAADAPVVLEHLIPLAEALQGRRRVVALEMPGFGFSRPHRDYRFTLPEQVGVLLGLLDALGVGRPHRLQSRRFLPARNAGRRTGVDGHRAIIRRGKVVSWRIGTERGHRDLRARGTEGLSRRWHVLPRGAQPDDVRRDRVRHRAALGTDDLPLGRGRSLPPRHAARHLPRDRAARRRAQLRRSRALLRYRRSRARCVAAGRPVRRLISSFRGV